LLEYFLLPNKILEDRAGNLSGGEKARISFILSWIRAQKYLLIDEADSYLNKELKQKLYKFLKENSSNKTILFATHNEDLKNVFYHYFSIEN
jgi:ABC-type multidrug transport system ATPase subunit